MISQPRNIGKDDENVEKNSTKATTTDDATSKYKQKAFPSTDIKDVNDHSNLVLPPNVKMNKMSHAVPQDIGLAYIYYFSF